MIWEGGSSVYLLFVDHPVTMRVRVASIDWAGPLMVYDGASSPPVTNIIITNFTSTTRSRLAVLAAAGTGGRAYELLAAASTAGFIGFSAEL
jgi:uncharacterized protein (UPF0261 family)